MKFLATAAAAGILAALLTPAPAHADITACNQDGDEAACDRLLEGPGLDYVDPCGGLKNPCGPEDDVEIEDNDATLCANKAPGWEEHCPVEEPAAPEPEPAAPPEPVYDPPAPDATRLGGDAWWHDEAQVIVCGSSTAGW